MNKIKYIIIGLIILTILIGIISAVNAKEINTVKGIKEQDGQLIDINNNNKIIGSIQKFNREEMASRSIPNGDTKMLSTNPIVHQTKAADGTYIKFTTEQVKQGDGRHYTFVIKVTDDSPETIDKIVEFCKANTKYNGDD